ncbi:hypothetical protein IV417_11305 [Alphaproteobacteria bacterium KMM 3653]|uniref:Uncharacterized protein n=1 Tax=Harenicola maris TaxID=2841044 RepID=A0AAP2CQS5_9RHOB|nr:hypothetical protein [Harenicola maris]
MTIRPLPLLAATLFAATPLAAQTNDRFWILWERMAATQTTCAQGQTCTNERDFFTRQFAPARPDVLYQLFGVPNGQVQPQPNPHPDAPSVCSTAATAMPDFETMEISDAKLTLRGLTDIGVDLTALSAPPGATDQFGPDLHARFVAGLQSVGIKAVTMEEAEALPGQPKLSIFFSFTDPNGHCAYSYSVFASLSQTAVLTRDPTVKRSVGTWSFSAKPPAGPIAGTERDTILTVLDALIEDVRSANE